MPIEIRELSIKINLDESSKKPNSEKDASKNSEEIVNMCLEEISFQEKRKKER